MDLANAAFRGKNIMVTGGAGFMGSDVVRAAVAGGARRVTVFDSLTYAGDLERLREASDDHGFAFIQGDVRDQQAVQGAFDRGGPDVVLHYAAETHVTRGEVGHDHFFETNAEGTKRILEVAARSGASHFVHISTDEVYGPITEGSCKEEDKLPGEGRATSSYARSKAVADDAALAYSSELPVTVLRFGNVFGPFQHPEKAIPRWVTRGLTGSTLPVWGGGGQVRQWMVVDDHTDAIASVLASEATGVYNVAGNGDEMTNLQVARRIAALLEIDPSRVELTGYDRPGHDVRYSMDTTKIRALGWQPSAFAPSLARTVDWYAEHDDWWKPHADEAEALYRSTHG